jgi:uncharacterized protein YrrD
MLLAFSAIRNFSLAATDGDIGKIKEFYFDDHTWRVRYLVVDTGGWLSGRRVLIAPRLLGQVDGVESHIAVNLTRAQVEQSPPIEAGRPLSRQYEEAWHRHYGLQGYWLAPEAVAFGAMPAVPSAAVVGAAAERRMQAGDPHLRSSGEVLGYAIHARDGDLGKLDDLVLDEGEWRIRYISISQSFWSGKRVVLSPEWIESVSWEDRRVVVSVDRETIKNAPEWLGAEPMTREYEERLHAHYERQGYWPLMPVV